MRHTKNGVRQVWVDSKLAAEIIDGEIANQYLWGFNLFAREEPNSNSIYYEYNAHGDVIQLTDWNGAKIREYHYDAFGVEQSPDPADTNPFRYCGEYFDQKTGPYYLRARYYGVRRNRTVLIGSNQGEISGGDCRRICQSPTSAATTFILVIENRSCSQIRLHRFCPTIRLTRFGATPNVTAVRPV